MCGFCCYFHLQHSDNGYPNLDLDSSLEYVHHRGPDSRGKYISPNGRCGLGHVRLSIIDLNGGQQPIINASGDIQTVVNGELYDFERIREELEGKGHQFKTLSDSEIALHLFEEYDIGFLEHLRGEFAICIYDAKRNRLIAARDRFGIKPLYYTTVNNTLYVASEMKSFLGLGWKPEWDVDSIVQDGVNTDHRTVFKGVYKLPPGHYLMATSTGSIDIRQYWDADYPDKNVKETRSVEEMIQGVRERIIEAVKYRLRADVPVAVYLSGGIDSSCITGIAAELLRKENPDAKIQTLSISFKDSATYDESAIAERTAKSLNVDFDKLVLTEDDLFANFEGGIWHCEQPQGNLNGIGKYLLSRFARDKGYKVVLTGEGSDEHFAGYIFFQADYLLEADNATPNGFGALPTEERLAKLEMFGKNNEFKVYMDNLLTMENKTSAMGRMVNNITTPNVFTKAMGFHANYFAPSVLEQTGAPDPGLNLVQNIDGVARYKANNKWHPLHTAMYVENHTFLPNYLCNMMGDRSEMAHSIEARTPFLDHHLCEYVNNLPPSLKMYGGKNGVLNEKWILKEAVKPYITEEIYNRTKHPFIAPSSNGRNQSTIDFINKIVNKENLDHLGWANTDEFLQKKEEFFETGNSTIFRDMLYIMSYIVLAEKFNVATHSSAREEVAR